MRAALAKQYEGIVSGRVVRLARGARLREGMRVRIVLLEPPPPAAPKKPGRTAARHRFASEDLVGCHVGDGQAASNAAARARLARRRAS